MCSDDTCGKYACTFCSYAVSQLHCSSTEFTEVELILGGCCFKFPDQLGIWAVETGLEKQPSFSNYCQCALEQGSCTQCCHLCLK